MAHIAWEFHGTCVWTHMPFNGYMMYTYIDLEYQSHLSTTYISDEINQWSSLQLSLMAKVN